MTTRRESVDKILKSFWRLRQQMFHQHLQSHHHDVTATPTQLQVLFLVKENSGIGVTDIAKKLNISNSAATQLVNELVEKDLLTRKCDANDRRVYRLCLTQKIKIHLVAMKNERIKKMSGVFANLSDEELETFSHLIEKIMMGEKNKND